MITLRRLLCPVDFSPFSERALRQSAAIARWFESEITVLYVEEPLISSARSEAASKRGVPGPSGIDELREFVASTIGAVPKVTPRATDGDAVAKILEEARRTAADLIVMGTQGRTGLSRLVLGSVAERVLRQADCPVMTIPPAAESAAPDVFEPFNPILCASDFSPACLRALDVAMAMAQEADAKLILLHAFELPPIIEGYPPATATAMATGDVDGLRSDAKTRLERALPRDADLRFKPEILVEQAAARDAILGAARQQNVKLIAMGAQARGTLDRLIFGSTTRSVIQAAACPVLSVRADAGAPEWPPAPSD
jgi:nucleotide-binding universal stress UspA family protein